MLDRMAATPCPVSDTQSSRISHEYCFDDNNTTTTNLDFTSAFRPSLLHAKPKRRQAPALRRGTDSSGFIIHEDEQPITLLPNERTSIQSQPRKSATAYYNKARSIHKDVTASSSGSQNSPYRGMGEPQIFAKPRRFNVVKGIDKESLRQDETLSAIPSPKNDKPARRGTLYIPSDDTTMPSVYMGVFSPLKVLPRGSDEICAEQAENMTGLAAQMMAKRVSGQPVLSSNPKRFVLRPSTRLIQETAILEDKTGLPTGKENLPPGSFDKPGFNTKKSNPTKIAPQNSISVQNVRRSHQSFSRCGGVVASTTDNAKGHGKKQAQKKPAWNSAPCPQSPRTKQQMRDARLPFASSSPVEVPGTVPKARIPSRIVAPFLHAEPWQEAYPLLVEDLGNVSLYEDNWLVNQEIAITQLLNALFQAANPTSSTPVNYAACRTSLLQQYSSSEMVLLHNRVHGALMYGALSIPNEMIETGRSLYLDLAKRKAFLDLWLNTYNHDTLQIALEVVVGRQIDSQGIEKSSSSRGSLSKFIQTFLIRNLDSSSSQVKEVKLATCDYQRTVLRSLMLVKLLDLIKTAPILPHDSQLFRAQSQHTTSAGVLQSLMQMLNPSVGDPMRALNHLGYTTRYSQPFLEGYSHRIDNIATDLRDGIRLTRIVELLLYRSSSPGLSRIDEADEETTLRLPTGETLLLTRDRHTWPLSQHLKIPCISRIAKIYNVQIALTALSKVEGMESLTAGINAEDIVDGFREKTIKLIWGLSSNWGLAGLIDLQDVCWETKRLTRNRTKSGLDYFYEQRAASDRFKQPQQLLKTWVNSVAESHSVSVRNFSTSFADGKIFSAILDEYEPYLLNNAQRSTTMSLGDRLQRLGCSQQFCMLFANTNDVPGVQHVFDHDFVLASLSFLCSRLLGPSKSARAATVIQSAWRRHQSTVERTRRARLKAVAQACSGVVQAKQQVADAKDTVLEPCKSSLGRLNERHQQLNVLKLAVPVTDEIQIDERDIWLNL